MNENNKHRPPQLNSIDDCFKLVDVKQKPIGVTAIPIVIYQCRLCPSRVERKEREIHYRHHLHEYQDTSK